jgi:glucose/arabinose dehydrogenase
MFRRTFVILCALAALLAVAPVVGAATTRVEPANHARGERVSIAGSDFAGGRGGTVAPRAVAFDRSHILDVNFPTSMVWAKDGRLYVTELLGRIHAFKFNAAKKVVGHQVIGTLGDRMPLGITEDPDSTARNPILWISHGHPPDFSRPSGFFKNAPVNSGVVSRLRKSKGFKNERIITGLPRSANDHAVNNLHFRRGKLYIAVGGNTGAGAAFSGDNEFQGLRGEQPLSAAIIVAKVKKAGFNGNCANRSNIYAPPPCMRQGWVKPYATGLRNSYDFVFHPNGSTYATDNGLGLNGMFPPSPKAPCTGHHSGYNEAFDPTPGQGTGVNDWLFRVTAGSYHGHPNPSRRECVWMDGSKQGVGPRADYSPPILDLGPHRSANSMIVYRSRVFGGPLRNELLITNYASQDTITRTRLRAGGKSVVSHQVLAVPRPAGDPTDFGDPLGLAQARDGTLFVGEPRYNRVAVLRPKR